jgi:hypothetical protein
VKATTQRGRGSDDGVAAGVTRAARLGPAGVVAERAVEAGARGDDGDVNRPGDRNVGGGAPLRVVDLLCAENAMSSGKEGGGAAGLYTPPHFSPGWWLQP